MLNQSEASWECKVPNPKVKAQKKSEGPNTNRNRSNQRRKFGAWSFFGNWHLEFEAFHLSDSATRYFLTNSSFNVMPSPGPSGAEIHPSFA